MARPRLLENESRTAVFEELVFTEAALLADPEAKEFAPQVGEQIEAWEAAMKELRSSLRSEIGSRAVAAVRDAELDDTVITFSDDLLVAVQKDRKDSRFTRYFKESPSRFVRIGRLVQAKKVQSWISSVSTEKDERVAAHADALQSKTAESLAALDHVAETAGQRAMARVRVWDAFIQEVDIERADLHADLNKLGIANKKARNWADRFFRTGSRRASSDEPEGGASDLE